MKAKRDLLPRLALAMATFFALGQAGASAPSKEQEALDIGTEAYIFGYPLVTMEMTRRVMTNVPRPEGKHAPMGQFAKLRTYPSAEDKVVTAPNADTLYTLAWLDVGKEPWVFSIPNAGDRYYLMPLLNGWTTVFEAPGQRTIGSGPQNYLITGPGWKGTPPPDLNHYTSSTAIVWILGRFYCKGTEEDYNAVHELQDRCGLVPFSSYKHPYTAPEGKVDPGIDMNTPVRDQVNKMEATNYFKLLAELMKNNTPSSDDAAVLERMAKIGLVPGQEFDPGKLAPPAAKALREVPRAAQEKIMAYMGETAAPVNGWMFTTNTGAYGTNYLQRALITAIGLGANLPQDAIYPTSQADVDGRPYGGTNKYVMHFDQGQMPPVKGFWSLTMYNSQYFFVPNPLNRQTLSQRNEFKKNADGSIDLYMQHDSPGKEKEPNWLPAPKDKFILMLRFYWPEDSIINGSWKPPGVKRIE